MKEFFSKIRDADIRNVIAIIFVVGVFIIIYLYLLKEMPDRNKDILLMATGHVMGGVSIVLGYYFGASKKDADKADK